MSFLKTLSLKDRRRLRTIVKKTHLHYYPKNMITDYEADKWINAQGPKVLYKMIKHHVDKGNV